MGIQRLGGFVLGDKVVPVSIVDSGINLSAITVAPLFGVPASAGEVVAPAANTRLADTGQLAAGNWTIFVIIGTTDQARFRLRRRNAADAADIWASMIVSPAGGGSLQVGGRFSVAQNERFVLENTLLGVGTYQAVIFALAG